jgi:hypothetical protein
VAIATKCGDLTAYGVMDDPGPLIPAFFWAGAEPAARDDVSL